MSEWQHLKLRNSAMNVEILLHYQISGFAVNVESRDYIVELCKNYCDRNVKITFAFVVNKCVLKLICMYY